MAAKVTFISRCPNQVLCIKPSRVRIADGISEPVPGKHARFENGQLVTEDPETIQYIRKHRMFGSRIAEIKEAKKPAGQQDQGDPQ